MSSNKFEKTFRDRVSQLKDEESKRSEEEKKQQAKALSERLGSLNKADKTPVDQTDQKIH